MMKICSRCHEGKELSEFHKNRCRPDGLQHYCKSCRTVANRAWARKHPEVRRATLKRQYEAEQRNGRRQSKTVDPFKSRAHHAVARAIRAGLLIRPDRCPTCGASQFPIEAHHDDYSKPLTVRWLCAPCHGAFHAGIRKRA